MQTLTNIIANYNEKQFFKSGKSSMEYLETKGWIDLDGNRCVKINKGSYMSVPIETAINYEFLIPIRRCDINKNN